MDQQNVLIGSGLRLNEVAGLGDSGCDQTITNTPILFGGKDVTTDR
jgi:hypothetical protein